MCLPGRTTRPASRRRCSAQRPSRPTRGNRSRVVPPATTFPSAWTATAERIGVQGSRSRWRRCPRAEGRIESSAGQIAGDHEGPISEPATTIPPVGVRASARAICSPGAGRHDDSASAEALVEPAVREVASDGEVRRIRVLVVGCSRHENPPVAEQRQGGGLVLQRGIPIGVLTIPAEPNVGSRDPSARSRTTVKPVPPLRGCDDLAVGLNRYGRNGIEGRDVQGLNAVSREARVESAGRRVPHKGEIACSAGAGRIASQHDRAIRAGGHRPGDVVVAVRQVDGVRTAPPAPNEGSRLPSAFSRTARKSLLDAQHRSRRGRRRRGRLEVVDGPAQKDLAVRLYRCGGRK